MLTATLTILDNPRAARVTGEPYAGMGEVVYVLLRDDQRGRRVVLAVSLLPELTALLPVDGVYVLRLACQPAPVEPDAQPDWQGTLLDSSPALYHLETTAQVRSSQDAALSHARLPGPAPARGQSLDKLLTGVARELVTAAAYAEGNLGLSQQLLST